MFHSFNTVPMALEQAIVANSDPRCTIDKLESCCLITDPIVVDGALTKVSIRGVVGSDVRGVRDFTYYRTDLAVYFKNIPLSVDLGATVTLINLINQLYARTGVLFELSDLQCDFTIDDAGDYTVTAVPTSYLWIGSVKVKAVLQLPKESVRIYNSEALKVGAIPYSWNLSFTDYALFSRFNKRTDNVSLSHILAEVTGDAWCCVSERASWNLWRSEVVSDGPHEYTDRTETHCLIIKLHPEYCESIGGWLYLFYTPHQGIK